MNLLAFLRIRKAEVLRRVANLLPIIFNAVLLVFAENSALEAYRTFERIEASNASEAIQAGRDIGDQAKLVEMSRRKLGNRLILGFTAEDADDIREALGRLLATIENARPSFIMPGDAALITQIDSIAELASGLSIAFASVGPRRFRHPECARRRPQAPVGKVPPASGEHVGAGDALHRLAGRDAGGELLGHAEALHRAGGGPSSRCLRYSCSTVGPPGRPTIVPTTTSPRACSTAGPSNAGSKASISIRRPPRRSWSSTSTTSRRSTTNWATWPAIMC